MAFGKSVNNTKEVFYKKYIGIGKCNVLCINPNKAEMKKYLDFEPNEEPNYITEKDGIKSVRVAIHVQPLFPDGTRGDIQNLTIFLSDEPRKNRDGSKIQIIDKYGRTAWATSEEFKTKSIPTYASGSKAQISEGYRAAFVGEETLINFFKAFLGIPDVMLFNKETNEWYMRENPEDAECGLDNIKQYFKGDFKELKSAINYQPDNQIKLLFGIRSTNDGKLRQTFFTNIFMKPHFENYPKLQTEVEKLQSLGMYQNTKFEFGPIHEFSPAPTKVVEEPVNTGSEDGLPF